MVWAVLGLLALINLCLLIYIYQELKERLYSMEEAIIVTKRSLLDIDIELSRQIKNISKEIIVTNYLKIP